MQTFPDDSIHGAWGAAVWKLGNAVPVRLAEVIGRQLSRVLKVNDLADELDPLGKI
jgi:DNA (cytosine-5)-methyltransferase 1